MSFFIPFPTGADQYFFIPFFFINNSFNSTNVFGFCSASVSGLVIGSEFELSFESKPPE